MSMKRFSQDQNPPLKLSIPALYQFPKLKKLVAEMGTIHAPQTLPDRKFYPQ
jgi:hypothetical protein